MTSPPTQAPVTLDQAGNLALDLTDYFFVDEKGNLALRLGDPLVFTTGSPKRVSIKLALSMTVDSNGRLAARPRLADIQNERGLTGLPGATMADAMQVMAKQTAAQDATLATTSEQATRLDQVEAPNIRSSARRQAGISALSRNHDTVLQRGAFR
jgi:hypothetical protein